MMPTTAQTIKEGHQYELGDLVVWFTRKPGQGRRITLFVKADDMTICKHIDRPPDSGDNDAAD